MWALQNTRRTLRCLLATGAASVALATGAAAQTGPAQDSEPDVTMLDEVVVTGIARDFVETDTSSVTRFEADTLDLPLSVSVITNDLLELANISDLGESAVIIGGVSYGGRNFARPQFNYRGFEGGVDGSVRTDTYPSNLYFLPDVALIEQIDVVKGPVSVTYGQIPPGGTINLVTKQPTLQPQSRFRASVASWDRYRIEGDVSAPLTSDGSVRGRAVVAYEDAGSFVDFGEETTRVIGGSILAEPTERLSLFLKGFYQDRDARYDVGGSVFAGTFAFPDVRRSTFYGQPWNRSEFAFGNLGARATWALTDNIDLNAIFDYQYVSRYNLFAALNGPLDAQGTAPQVRREDAEGVSDNYTYEINLTGRFSAFGAEHPFFIGLSHFDGRDTDVDHARVTLPGRFSVFAPDYTTPLPNAPLASVRVGYSESTALSAQTLLSLTPRLKLLLGGRYTEDRVDVPIYGCGTPTAPALCPLGTSSNIANLVRFASGEVNASAREFVPTTGLTFALTDDLNLYANYARSFQLQSGRTVAGELIAPSEGEQFEIGLKASLFGNRLVATAAVYEITKTNIQQNDVDNPGFFLVTGEQRSRGFELEAVGALAPGWNVIGQYTYIDAEITRDRVNQGRRPQRVPEHSGSLFTTYEIQEGRWAGLGFGAGVIHVGERPATSANLFEQDAYTVVDAQVFYNFGPYEALFSVSNAADEAYYNVTFDGSPNGVLPGSPRSFRFSLARRF